MKDKFLVMKCKNLLKRFNIFTSFLLKTYLLFIVSSLLRYSNRVKRIVFGLVSII